MIRGVGSGGGDSVCVCVPCVCGLCVCTHACASVQAYMGAGEENRTTCVDIRAAFFVQNMAAQL